MDERCKSYVGLACVDGSCPKIDHDEFGGYIRPIVNSCCECGLYYGCEDCYFEGTSECPREEYKGLGIQGI